MNTVRKLTDEGVRRFTEYLKRLKAGEQLELPNHLLKDEDTSEPLQGTADVERQPFPSKQAAAEYLVEQLSGVDKQEVDNNVGLWTWLALFYFDEICPPNGHGVRKPGELVRYVLSQRYNKYYRHLLAGPYRLLQWHGQNARVFLNGKLTEHGDFSETFASRQQILSNPALIEAVDRLYYDPSSNGQGKPKRGATTRTRPGNARRLVNILQQFEPTFDMYAMTADQILELLPAEFDKWKGEA